MILLMELSTEKIYTADSEANISQKRPTYSSSNLYQLSDLNLRFSNSCCHFLNPSTGSELPVHFAKNLSEFIPRDTFWVSELHSII